jgi:hypothetical protein
MERVRQLIKDLEDKGWTIAAIADAIGFSRDSVERWLNGGTASNPKVVEVALKDLFRKPVPPQRRYTRKRKSPRTTG